MCTGVGTCARVRQCIEETKKKSFFLEKRKKMQSYSLPETEPDAKGQLYHLENDPGETTNLYFSEERKRKEMQELLASLIGTEGRSAPLNRQPISNW